MDKRNNNGKNVLKMNDKKITMLSTRELVDFEAQPFKVLEDGTMEELVKSIKEVGVLMPIIVRNKADKYEIISGHRRKKACELAGIEKIPAFIETLDDDEAAILLVDSNLQRENLLPSEKAYAYKLKLEAIKNQGKKRSETFGQNVRNIEATDIIGEKNSKSGRQIRRYIRLTELIYQLLEKVDAKRIPIVVGSEISYLNVPSQFLLNDKLDENDCGLTTKQALEIKKLFLENKFNEEVLNEILKANEIEKEKTNFNYDRLKSYFPKEYSKSDCEKALWKILDKWFEN